MTDTERLAHRRAWRHSLGLPDTARVILAACPDDAQLFRLAVWTFDILRHTDPRLWLVLSGCSVHREPVLHFARQLAYDDYRVAVLPEPYHETWAAWADVVWYASGRREIPLEPNLFSLAGQDPVALASTTYRYLTKNNTP